MNITSLHDFPNSCLNYLLFLPIMKMPISKCFKTLNHNTQSNRTEALDAGQFFLSLVALHFLAFSSIIDFFLLNA